jgi:GNAT superfamily N-acetyltransferase
MKHAQSLVTLDFAIEPFRQVYDEMKALLVPHYEEVAKDKHLFRLAVDESFYDAIQARGNLVIVTARHEGRLAGYFVWFTAQHPHYKNVRVAEEDVHFMLPEYRRGMAGYMLIKRAVELVGTVGVKHWKAREKIGHEHPALWKRLGFKPTDVVYAKSVGIEEV